MDEVLVRILITLVRIHEEFGDEAFDGATHRVLVAIGRTFQIEAEERASEHRQVDAQILRFPIERRIDRTLDR